MHPIECSKCNDTGKVNCTCYWCWEAYNVPFAGTIPCEPKECPECKDAKQPTNQGGE